MLSTLDRGVVEVVEVVEDDHLITSTQQCLDDVAADETCAAGDEHDSGHELIRFNMYADAEVG